MRQFLDRLPLVIQAKGTIAAGSGRSRGPSASTSRKLLDATLNHRRATMRYFSMSSGREKDYVIEPYRLVYSPPGGLYLLAFVPEYQSVRTFYVDRIRGLSLHEERFTPPEILDAAFAHSLGVNEGPPEHIEIAFEPRIAPLRPRTPWHASQRYADRPDGGVVAVAGRLQRLGAAKLDPLLRPARARAVAAGRWRRRSRTRSIARARATPSSEH